MPLESDLVSYFVEGLGLLLLAQDVDVRHNFLPRTLHRLFRLIVVSLTQYVESSDILVLLGALVVYFQHSGLRQLTVFLGRVLKKSPQTLVFPLFHLVIVHPFAFLQFLDLFSQIHGFLHVSSFFSLYAQTGKVVLNVDGLLEKGLVSGTRLTDSLRRLEIIEDFCVSFLRYLLLVSQNRTFLGLLFQVAIDRMVLSLSDDVLLYRLDVLHLELEELDGLNDVGHVVFQQLSGILHVLGGLRHNEQFALLGLSLDFDVGVDGDHTLLFLVVEVGLRKSVVDRNLSGNDLLGLDEVERVVIGHIFILVFVNLNWLSQSLVPVLNDVSHKVQSLSHLDHSLVLHEYLLIQKLDEIHHLRIHISESDHLHLLLELAPLEGLAVEVIELLKQISILELLKDDEADCEEVISEPVLQFDLVSLQDFGEDLGRHINGSVVVDGFYLHSLRRKLVVHFVDEEVPLLAVRTDEVGSDVSVEFPEVLEGLESLEHVAVEEQEIQVRNEVEIDCVFQIIEKVVYFQRLAVFFEVVKFQKRTGMELHAFVQELQLFLEVGLVQKLPRYFVALQIRIFEVEVDRDVPISRVVF